MKKRLLALLVVLFISSSFVISNEAGKGKIKNEKVVATITYKSNESIATTLQPIVVITSPEDGAVVNEAHLVVLGYATDEAGMNYWEWEWHWKGGSYSNSSYFETAQYVEFRIDIYGLHPGWNLVIVRFKNIYGAIGEDSVNVTYKAPNNPPNKPSRPEGPTEGKVKTTLYYSTVTTDPDGDSLEYLIDWGDGTNTGWMGPIASGYPFETFHSWDKPGTYLVKAKARDIPYYAESEWSEPLIVTIYGNDTEPPIVVIEYPPDGATFTESNITVIGYAEDNVGIVSFGYTHEWEGGGTGSSWPLEEPTTYYSFEIPLTLHKGWNRIEVYATDEAGNVGYDDIHVNLSSCKKCKITILTQNCQLLLGFSYVPDKRAEILGGWLSPAGRWGQLDIICLQEAFHKCRLSFLRDHYDFQRKVTQGYLGNKQIDIEDKKYWHKLDRDREISLDGIKVKLIKANPVGTDIQQIAVMYNEGRFAIVGPDSTAEPRNTYDGGLMILTKHRVLAASGFTFSDQAGWEAFSNKGALYARIQVDPKNPNCYIHIFNTHLASGDAKEHRAKQLKEIIEFIKNCIADDENKHPIIFCGDFNIIGESNEYNQRLKNFKIDNLQLFDTWIKLGKPLTKEESATWVGKDKKLPENSPWGPKNELAMEDGDYQRLDYIFYYEGKQLLKANPLSIKREPSRKGGVVVSWTTGFLWWKEEHKSYTISDHLGLIAEFELSPK